MKRLPILPTLLVLIAVGVMIRLGFWQIERLHEKEAMMARYASAQGDRGVHRWPDSDREPLGYTRLQLECVKPSGTLPQAGRNAAGRSGWAQVASCQTLDGAKARVVLGWSDRPVSLSWTGGTVTGTYLPRGEGMLVIADPPLAGLQPNARPDPHDIPNNHFAYAVQWFLFAGVALVIYGLALRKRLRG
ncbi:SURF1 family protein [Novosphingobium sp.]|uniref:SURF1 family protein n=1 Tax=Novosphingobium sp. TaxID=1874826 RepID=UPI0038BD9151